MGQNHGANGLTGIEAVLLDCIHLTGEGLEGQAVPREGGSAVLGMLARKGLLHLLGAELLGGLVVIVEERSAREGSKEVREKKDSRSEGELECLFEQERKLQLACIECKKELVVEGEEKGGASFLVGLAAVGEGVERELVVD